MQGDTCIASLRLTHSLLKKRSFMPFFPTGNMPSLWVRRSLHPDSAGIDLCAQVGTQQRDMVPTKGARILLKDGLWVQNSGAIGALGW